MRDLDQLGQLPRLYPEGAPQQAASLVKHKVSGQVL